MMADRKYSNDHRGRGDRDDRRRQDRHETSDRHRSRGHSSRDRDRDRPKREHERRSRSRRRERHVEIERPKSRSLTPLHLKKRKIDNWDKIPLGYEGMTCQQVKDTGHFPLPGHIGALKVAGLLPSFHNSNMALSMGLQGPMANIAGFNAGLEKQARRIYVGNIPFALVEHEIADFFNFNMIQLRLAEDNPVVLVQINHEKNYCFIEFRTPEEATAAMGFDGITFQGQGLKIRRPNDYKPLSQNSGSSTMDSVSSNVEETDNKIFIAGLPGYLKEENVMELLGAFGVLKSFNLVRDGYTGNSKGYAFCEYVEPSLTDIACEGLNDMELGERKLTVQRASLGMPNLPSDLAAEANSVFTQSAVSLDPTRVLLLLNTVDPIEIEDDELHQECEQFGKVEEIIVPRIKDKSAGSIVGKVFVLFDSKESCSQALRSLAGRKFDNRTVLGSYYPEKSYPGKKS